MRASVPLCFLLVAVLAPVASAHAAFDGGAPLGEASLAFELVGAPIPSAGTPMEVRVRTDAPAPPELRMIPPEGAPGAWRAMVEDAGVWSAPVLLERAGRWGAEVRAGGETASFSFDAWPHAGAWVAPVGEAASRGVVVAGEPAAIRLQLVDASGRPLPPPADAVARVEGPAGVETVPLVPEGDALALSRAWGTPGEHALHVSAPSLGLAGDARPPLGLLVVPPGEAGVYGLDEGGGREVPVGAAVPVAGFLLAFALAAYARRR